MSRRVWRAALCLYAVAAAVDVAAHLHEDVQAGGAPIGLSEVAVAFAAGLFWPADLVGRILLKSSP